MYVSPLRQKAFPLGEGVGLADGRGHCLPLWGRCRLCRRKRTFFPFGEGVGFADGRGHCLPPLGKVSPLPTEEVIAFPFWGRCRLSRRKRTMRQKVSPLGGVCLSFELNWEECRRRDLIFNKNTQNGKEGLP